MRDDSTDPRDARDPNHIWLRQSVTFSVNGQTRTLELALPLRPGATPGEVDALLDEADAGMRRLSQRLDAHLAEVAGAASTAPTATAAPIASSAPTPPPTNPAPRNATPPAATSSPSPQPAPAAPQQTIAEQPAPRAEAPAPRSPAAPAAPAQPARPAPAATPAAATGGPDLTRPEFLAAVTALGLDARTVMERLNVRSLNGLNLREALDLLRRQVLREGGASADPQPAPAAPAASAHMPTNMPAPIGHAHFDEEDEEGDEINFELSYPDPDDLPGDDDDIADIADSADESFAPQEAPRAIAEATGPLSDVPDLDDLLAPAPAAASAATPATPAVDANAHTREVIATLRAAHPGGQPTAQQRMAYRNIVVDQLGEAKANSIARAIWSLTPDKLGPEQYDALIRWGKQDTFAEEVEETLAVLRAEWLAQQAAQQADAQPGQSGQPAKPATSSRRPAPDAQAPSQAPTQTPPARPAPRGRPTTSRANTDATRNGAGPQGGA